MAAQHRHALGVRIGGGGALRHRGRVLARALPLYGLPFGAAVWATGYVVLPEAGIYKPIWEYDAKTLAADLGGHLAYGAGTGTAFWLFVKLR
jgi:hypothetical protein